MTEAVDKDAKRNKELSRIHIMKGQLGIDDDTYRDMLESLTGKRSAKDLDYRQRWRVLCEMGKQLNPSAKAKQKPDRYAYPGRPAKQSQGKESLMGKIEALLTDGKLPWNYANGIAKKMFRVDLVEWCNPEQLRKIVAALEYNKKRLAAKAQKTEVVVCRL